MGFSPAVRLPLVEMGAENQKLVRNTLAQTGLVP
jgi:hypothetical protein